VQIVSLHHLSPAVLKVFPTPGGRGPRASQSASDATPRPCEGSGAGPHDPNPCNTRAPSADRSQEIIPRLVWASHAIAWATRPWGRNLDPRWPSHSFLPLTTSNGGQNPAEARKKTVKQDACGPGGLPT